MHSIGHWNGGENCFANNCELFLSRSRSIESRWLNQERKRINVQLLFLRPPRGKKWIESVETISFPSRSRLETVFVSKTAVKRRRFILDSIETERFYLRTIELTQSLTCNWATSVIAISQFTLFVQRNVLCDLARVSNRGGAGGEFYFIP